MRRKFGILFLIGVTVLAGTQEAVRQFDGLKSSITELTRAGLWSGLIVYAQPVSDGKLPSPQIYYLIPQPQTAPDAQGAILVDNRNNNNNAAAPKPEAKNNHSAEDVALSTDVTMALAAAAPREAEDAAKSELVIDKLPLNLMASSLAPAAKLEKKRVYEEVAKHESFARKFRSDAGDVIAKVFVKEFDAAKLEAELARLAAAQEQLENSKLKSSATPERESQRRLEVRVMRRAAAAARPEHIQRIKVLPRLAEKPVITLPDMSGIGCEKAATVKAADVEAASAPAAESAPMTAETTAVTAAVKIAGEPLVSEPVAPPAAILIPTSTSWALGCDSEPEEK